MAPAKGNVDTGAAVAVYVESVTVRDGEKRITVIHSEVHKGRAVLFKDDGIIRFKDVESSVIAGICIALEMKHIPHKNVVVYTSNERVVYTLNALMDKTEEPNKALYIRYLNAIHPYKGVTVKCGGLLSRHMRDAARIMVERKKNVRCSNNDAVA